MSEITVLENLVKFITINNGRYISKGTTLCTDSTGVRSRKGLSCDKKQDNSYLIKCDDCPFFSIENGNQTIDELNVIIKKRKVELTLLGNLSD